MEKFKKKVLTLRQYLSGARYFEALSAMEFASMYHVGTRKDGVTHEFDHQISIALHALTLPDLMHRQEVIATIMLHDVSEDYGITSQEIFNIFQDSEFGDRVCTAVENMTKEFRGIKKDEFLLFDMMGDDPIASIAKGCDRIHNFGSMHGVFTIEKQKDYIAECVKFFFPMLKKARRRFPQQTLAYESIKFTLNSQIELIEAIHAKG